MSHEPFRPIQPTMTQLYSDANREHCKARTQKLARIPISRREYLAGLAGSMLATSIASGPPILLAKEGAMLEPTRDQQAIDAHVHVWTPDTQNYPLTAGYRRDQMAPPSFTPEELLAHAEPCGVGRIVLIQMSFYGFDNRYMLETIAKFPGVFAGVAVINDEGPKIEERMKALRDQGVRGYRIYPRNLPVDRWLDSEGFQTMWRVGAETGQAMCHLINLDALPAIDRMCEKHPDTPAVIDHFARIGVDGQIREADVDLLCKLARHKNTYVKTSAFYALGAKQSPYTDLIPMIKRLLDAYTPERLMWATDCPYQVQEGHNYADSIALIRDHLDFLSAGDRDHLLRKTAEKVFFQA